MRPFWMASFSFFTLLDAEEGSKVSTDSGLRERSLTIGGGRAGKFWGRAVFFWAPIWGGP